jgi:hypothetical protein
MPPKSKKAEPGDPALEPLFTSIGLAPSRTKNVLQSCRSTDALAHVIRTCHLEGAQWDEKTAGLVAEVGSEFEGGKLGDREVSYLVERIKEKDVKSPDQVKGAESVALACLDVSCF